MRMISFITIWSVFGLLARSAATAGAS